MAVLDDGNRYAEGKEARRAGQLESACPYDEPEPSVQLFPPRPGGMESPWRQGWRDQDTEMRPDPPTGTIEAWAMARDRLRR